MVTYLDSQIGYSTGTLTGTTFSGYSDSDISYKAVTLVDPPTPNPYVDSPIGYKSAGITDPVVSTRSDSLIGFATKSLYDPHKPIGVWTGTTIKYVPLRTWNGTSLV